MQSRTEHSYFRARTGAVYPYAVRYAITGGKVSWIARVREGSVDRELDGVVDVPENPLRNAAAAIRACVNRRIDAICSNTRPAA